MKIIDFSGKTLDLRQILGHHWVASLYAVAVLRILVGGGLVTGAFERAIWDSKAFISSHLNDSIGQIWCWQAQAQAAEGRGATASEHRNELIKIEGK